jgi:L-lactate dehydrogenase complex protein LldE
MRIALFITCFNDALFPKTGQALVQILEQLGHQVDFPHDQSCCGQIHFNTGYRPEARRLMLRFLRVFEGAEAVVAPSASCVAMVREQYPVLASETGDPGLETAVSSLGSRVFEMSEFLVGRLGVEDLGASLDARVALHSTCHSMRSIDVGDAPLRLLRAVRGVEMVELPHSRECCGFGGTFSVKNPETSVAMLSDKIGDIVTSGAELLTAVDNSCLVNIAGGLRRQGLLREEGRNGSVRQKAGRGRGSSSGPGGKIGVMHLAEILASREGSPR